MNAGKASPPKAMLQEIGQGASTAGDDRVVRMLAFLETLPDRGLADTLIAPMRPRLVSLRPPRPPRFGRVLFLPLDPVIVPPAGWRRGSLGIPRSVLAPLAEQVRRGLGPEAEEIDRLLQAAAGDDLAAILPIGSRLWPAAAAILRGGAAPTDWSAETGLGTTDHVALARACAAVLAVAPDMQAMVQGSTLGVPPDLVRLGRMVAEFSPVPAEVGLLLAILLIRFPDAQKLIAAIGDAAAGQPDPQRRAAADTAIDFMLDAAEAGSTAHLDLTGAAREILRIAELLDGLAQPGPAFRPSRKARTEALRRRLDAQQRERFSKEIGGTLAEAKARLGPAPTDAATEDLEATMRGLRQFAGAAGRLGGAEHYDRELHGTAARIGELPLPAMDRVRLVEIVLGTEAALRLLPAISGAAA